MLEEKKNIKINIKNIENLENNNTIDIIEISNNNKKYSKKEYNVISHNYNFISDIKYFILTIAICFTTYTIIYFIFVGINKII